MKYICLLTGFLLTSHLWAASNQTNQKGICDRTSAVQEAIMQKTNKRSCLEVTNKDLKTIKVLDLKAKKLAGLKKMTFQDLRLWRSWIFVPVSLASFP